MCEVTYEKAVDGKLVPVQYSARFPEDDNKFVRVQRKHIFGGKLLTDTDEDSMTQCRVENTGVHCWTFSPVSVKHHITILIFFSDDVQNVRVLLNQQEVVGDYIDFSYYIEKDQGLPLISCDSDGFDPAGDNIVNGPDKKAIQSAVQAIRDGKSNKLRVECSAENSLNKKPVEVIKNFDVKCKLLISSEFIKSNSIIYYFTLTLKLVSDIGEIGVEEYPGLIKSMPVEYKISVPTSGDDAEVLLYPYSTDPLDGQDFGKSCKN